MEDVRLYIRDVLKAPCVISIIHETKNDKTYANISALGKLPKGTPAPELSNAPLYFSLDEPNWEIYDALSDGLKKVIGCSPEYQKLRGGNGGHSAPIASGSMDLDDEVPFAMEWR